MWLIRRKSEQSKFAIESTSMKVNEKYSFVDRAIINANKNYRMPATIVVLPQGVKAGTKSITTSIQPKLQTALHIKF